MRTFSNLLAVRWDLGKEFHWQARRGEGDGCRSVLVQLGAEDHTGSTIAMPYAVRSSHASAPTKHRSRSLAPWVLVWTLCLACGESALRPSILLVVLDTTRVDAVSAYGHVEGTTPYLDALATSGLRYTQAYSEANWTVPSHASLFVGLLPSQHGTVGFTAPLDESFLTLAERLQEHGYETVGVNENPWVGDPAKGLTQGFDHFVTVETYFTEIFRERSHPLNPPSAGAGSSGKMAEAVEHWLADRSTDRPFFLFLNIMDAHAPYKVRAANPHLPAGATAREARAVSQRARDHVCQTPRWSREMEILWALYLDGVSAADRKLGRVLEVLSHAGADENLIVVATADHGEHFGEQRLFLHDIGVRQPLIHVPLIVHGLPEVSPAVIDAPVQLLDLLPSVLAWAGADRDAGLPGRRLPARPRREQEPRIIFSECHFSRA